MDIALASKLAKLPLACLRREWPNKLDHVLRDDGDVRGPRALHPSFYGCLDWHSAVHGHWMLVRLVRRVPDLPEANDIRALLADTLAADKLAAEAAYVRAAGASFERPYGWGWLLALAAELHGWDDAHAAAIRPLAAAIASGFHAYLPSLAYPVRTGVHANTAFGMGLALDHARTVGDARLADLIDHHARVYFAADRDLPAAWEPSGEDFLSPALVEVDLMRRVLPADAFSRWLDAALPELPPSLAAPARVSDRRDPKHAHLDGLNLSRAWCLRAIDRPAFQAAADAHAREGLAHVATGDYMGEHWLASFAVYLLSCNSSRWTA